jgi:hypothetical protein
MTDEECKEKALPCPFCGEKPKVDSDHWSMYIFCNCEANPSFEDKIVKIMECEWCWTPIWDYTNVLKKWNTRKI